MDIDGEPQGTGSVSSRDGEAPCFQHVRTIQAHERAVSVLKFNPKTGIFLATGSADKTTKLWGVQQESVLQTLTGHTQGVNDVAWMSNSYYIATASDDHTVKLWDVETGVCLRTLSGHTNFVFCCSFSPTGNLLASGSFDETLRVWDVRQGHCLREVPAHSDPVTAVDFCYDSTMLVTSSLDGLCRIWDTATGHCLKTLFDRESPPVSHVRFTPNGRYLLSSSLDGCLRLWDYEQGRAIKAYRGHVNKQFCIPSTLCGPTGCPPVCIRRKCRNPEALEREKDVPSPPTPWVVTGSEDGGIYVYGLNSQKILQVLEPEGGLRAAAKSGSEEAGNGQGKPDNAPTGAAAAAGPATAAATAGDQGQAGKDGKAGSAAEYMGAVLAVDAHVDTAMLASCGHGQEGVVKLWQHLP